MPSAVDCCRAPKYHHTIDVLTRDLLDLCVKIRNDTQFANYYFVKSRYRIGGDVIINF